MLPYTPLAPPAAERTGRDAARDDQRQPLRRADRLRGRRRPRAAGGHRRLLPRPRPADPHPLRRLGDASRRPASSCRSGARAAMLPSRLALPIACRRADPGPRRPAEGDLRPRHEGAHAFLSHHIGDLDHYEACRPTSRRSHHLRAALRRLSPERSSTTCTPTIASTRYAQRAAPGGAPLIAVQHHHAHMASCMAENGLDEPVIGVTFDGTGFGIDGAIWGGEFLVGITAASASGPPPPRRACPAASRRSASRGGWRRPIWPMPDRMARLSRIACPRPSLATVETMIARRLNSPLTTSAGRLFDAVAALAGVEIASQLRRPGGDRAGMARVGGSPPTASIHSTWRMPPKGEQLDALVIDMRPMIGRGRRGRTPRCFGQP